MRKVIAIDGPAGSGKTTAAKGLAERMGFRLLDTGAIYRTVALAAKRRGIGWDDDEGLGRLAASLKIEFGFEGGTNMVFLDGEDVSAAIREPEISLGASAVSARPSVRAALLDLQRGLAGDEGAVVEGRDIGTVVFPDAAVKFFLDASAEKRAGRRTAELRASGAAAGLESTRRDIERRDASDSGRRVAPLKKASDAIAVDTSEMDIRQMLDFLEREARRRLGIPPRTGG